MKIEISTIADKYIKFFECCICVKGYSVSIVMDLQRNSFRFVPNDLVKIISKNEDKSIKEILISLDEDDIETFIEYVEFLLESEFVFLIDHEELTFFPSISKEWAYPCAINNVVIHLDCFPNFNFHDAIKQIDALRCNVLNLVLMYEPRLIIRNNF